MSNVVVAVGHIGIIREDNSPLEAVEGHVVLTREECTQANVIPKFSIVQATLHQSPVKPHCNLWLVSVEMITCDLGNSFDVVVVEEQYLLINFECLTWIVE
jgi:hypothetical protein